MKLLESSTCLRDTWKYRKEDRPGPSCFLDTVGTIKCSSSVLRSSLTVVKAVLFYWPDGIAAYSFMNVCSITNLLELRRILVIGLLSGCNERETTF